MEETTQTTANDSSVDEILLGSTDVNDQTMDISNDSEPISVQSDERVTGQVKWFNDRNDTISDEYWIIREA